MPLLKPVRKRGLLQPSRKGLFDKLQPRRTYVTHNTQARHPRRQQLQNTGAIVGIFGAFLIVIGALMRSLYGPLVIVAGFLFVVLGIVLYFSNSHKEAKKHAWKAWRELKSLFK